MVEKSPSLLGTKMRESQVTLEQLKNLPRRKVYDLLRSGFIQPDLFEQYLDYVFDEGVNEGVSNPYGP